MLGAGYAFISAYLKGEEAKVITSDHVGNMSRTSGVQDVLDVIRDTDVGNYLDGVSVQNFDELDEQLWAYFGECLRRLEWFKNLPSDIRNMLNAYMIKYDILNIKAVLQGLSTSKKPRQIPVGVIHNQGLLDELFSAQDVESIAELLSSCRLGNYAAVLEGYSTEDSVKSRLLVEAGLDEVYYRNLQGITGRMKDGTTLSRVFSIIADMVNLQIILRSVIGETGSEATGYTVGGGYLITEQVAKELMALKLTDIPDRLDNAEYRSIAEEIISNYDKSKSLAVVEEIIDKNKFRLLREILAPRVLSPLVAVWYLVIKEIEVRNLRLILKTTFDSISVEEIKDYLVLSS
ncbi:V-type ATPase subunit [Chloroflexota bacterium]